MIKNKIDIIEESLYNTDLLDNEYMKQQKEEYLDHRNNDFPINPYRNYLKILKYFKEINQYNPSHAASFAKRIKTGWKDWRNCEAVISEMIVYHNYIPLIRERLVKSLSLETDECDVIVERCDGSKYYLEVFCIIPNFQEDEDGVINIQTHTQKAFSSIRQKLLRKANKQRQFLTERENFAVIELNDRRIARDFTILSSLSDGYKIKIDMEKMINFDEGYDCEFSVFQFPETRFLKGIIWFHLGNYQDRKILINERLKE